MPRRALFLGRTRELALLEAAAGGPSHLVTVWGPPGAGKSALARRFGEGAGAGLVWVDLAGARTATDLVVALAAELGVAVTDSADAPAALARAAAGRGALVVADDADRLDEEARAILARIAEHARFVVTTRGALGVAGERLVLVPPLADDEALALYAALSDSEPDALARRIVARLDGLPLAIVLAAGRAPLLGNEELLARLDTRLALLGRAGESADTSSRPAHHRTLRGAIAWSWELLDAGEREALAACALFEGPFDAPLAEEVCSRADAPGGLALDRLERLRERALVQIGGADASGRPELSLLGAVRDYVRDEARTRGDEVSNPWAAAIVRRAEPAAHAVSRGQAVPSTLAARRRDLLRIAALPAGSIDAEIAARATIALAELLLVTGPFDLVVSLAAPPSDAVKPTAELAARLAIARGRALRATGHHDEAAAAATEAERIARNVPAERRLVLEGDALRLAGSVARSRGDATGAIPTLEAALARYRSAGEEALAGLCIGEIGAAHQSVGELARARELHEEAICAHVVSQSRRAEGQARSYFAVATHRLGHLEAAIPLHEAALAIHRAVGDRRMEGAELCHLGFVYHELGAPRAAREALAEARNVLAASGARGLEAMSLVLAARLAVDEGDLEVARVRLAEASAAAPGEGSRRAWSRLEATRLVVTGHLAIAKADHEAAVRAYEDALRSSRDVEVGFEALTPAYLALARSLAQDSGVAESLNEARAMVARVRGPFVAVAAEILTAAAERRPAPTPPAEAVARSSEVRRALAFAGTRSMLVVAGDARQVVLPDGRAVDLGRRKNLRLVLLALARGRAERPGQALSADDLVQAGWPDERIGLAAATKRLHTAIWTLRSLGLGTLLASSEAGYWLEPTVGLRLDK